MGRLRVEGNSNLVRDTRSGAIININRKEIERAKRLKAKRKSEEQALGDLQSEVSNLKNDVSDIKKLLEKLVENKQWQ
jgi:uncharacterized protein YceH (UPF0502 family)